MKMGIMFNRALDVLLLKWGRAAGGFSGSELPWRTRFPLPPPMHFSENYCVPSSRKRVCVLHTKCMQKCGRAREVADEIVQIICRYL